VIDTGPGVAPEMRDKLFRPFQTTKPGGSGLGLPTVKRIVEAHGGTIDVQSAPGHGTKFAIRLPIQRT
jgi:signal transduction histidine kinase